jgi:hypothetical protein
VVHYQASIFVSHQARGGRQQQPISRPDFDIRKSMPGEQWVLQGACPRPPERSQSVVEFTSHATTITNQARTPAAAVRNAGDTPVEVTPPPGAMARSAALFAAVAVLLAGEVQLCAF